ncbi:MAG: phosphoserine aminotransferase [Bacteroidota bacterium]|jgi:phosphoserine aminotransferase
MKQHNFGAGPGILPKEVIEESAEAVLNFNNSGLSILEISHRSKGYEAVMKEARSLVRELLNVPTTHEVLFLHGGASTQFAMVPWNLLKQKAGYIESGVWAQKAIHEAKILGEVEIIASSSDKNFSYVPKDYVIPSDIDYLHVTSNNTIYGTQMKSFPTTEVPLVCDMSSDIFSRPIDVSKFGLIYAGAQKNMGPAGATLVIVQKDLLGKSERKINSMLDYGVHIKAESMYNTPPAFPIFVCMLTLRWLKKMGGVIAIEKLNIEKANLFYEALDNNVNFIGNVVKEDRSLMNACFNLKDTEMESRFLQACEDNGIVGIKGHRLSGGFRASLYNALPIESVHKLIEVMNNFN